MGNSTTRRTGFYFWLFELDRILRGEATRPADIRQADIKIPVVGVAVIVILLAAIYGFCMGIFALVRGVENSEYQQALLQTFASMCKVPLLFFLTLVVTFPSLYVFNALVGSKLRVLPVLKLLVASLAVNLAVLASMGPILAFFSVSTPNYSFIVLLNVVVFSVAGMLGLVFLIQTLNRLALAERHQSPLTELRPSEVDDDVAIVSEVGILASDAISDANTSTAQLTPVPVSGAISRKLGPLDQLEGVVLGYHVRKVFACWIVVFGLVGAQMGWVLRPFIGSPSTPFSWFRARHSNFFEAVFNTLKDVLF
jgi:hypothetical protein